MKKEMPEPVELLYHRVADRLYDILYNQFDANHKEWSDEERWFNYIQKNINNLLNKEEKEAIIKRYINKSHDEDMSLSLAVFDVSAKISGEMKFIIQLLDKYPIDVDNKDDIKNTDDV